MKKYKTLGGLLRWLREVKDIRLSEMTPEEVRRILPSLMFEHLSVKDKKYD